MNLNDALLFLGQDHRLEAFQRSNLKSLRQMMDMHGIRKAFLTAFACRTFDIDYGNRLIFETARKDARLIPCPAIVPDSGLEIGDEAAHVDKLIRKGARCVCLYPQGHGIRLEKEIIGALFSILEERRLPLAIFDVDVPTGARLAAQYPKLPIIVHGAPSRNRSLIPYLKYHPNLHIALGLGFAPYRGLEMIAANGGAQQILLASAYPVCEPGAAIAHVLHSALDPATIQAIAFGNMQRLLTDVRDKTGLPIPSEPVAAPRRTGAKSHHRKKLVPFRGAADMHAHYGKWTEFPVWGGEAEDLVAEMDRLGMETIWVSHQASMSTEAAWGNDQVLKAMKRFPTRIRGYAICYPVDETAGIKEIRRCVAAGMRGIKMHNSNGVQYNAPGYEPVWALADARRIPVLLHTWADLHTMQPLFERYRNLPILLGHSGANASANMYVEYAKRHPHLFIELCFSRAPYGLVEYFIRQLGAERIVFGSDAPWMSMQQQLGRLLYAGISERDQKIILVENPQRICAGIRD
jgi:predicted TIM-barrel fold metal-dependent hydrolase